LRPQPLPSTFSVTASSKNTELALPGSALSERCSMAGIAFNHLPGETARGIELACGGLETAVVENMATRSAPASLTPDLGRPRTEDPGPLRAAHAPNFPALLRQLGASLLVTTYQAGRLVMVRDEGDHLNTHYRAFQSPMGLALADGGARLALGTTLQVWEF